MENADRKKAWRDGIVAGLKVLGFIATLAIGMFVMMCGIGLWMGPLLAVLLWKR